MKESQKFALYLIGFIGVPLIFGAGKAVVDHWLFNHSTSMASADIAAEETAENISFKAMDIVMDPTLTKPQAQQMLDALQQIKNGLAWPQVAGPPTPPSGKPDRPAHKSPPSAARSP